MPPKTSPRTNESRTSDAIVLALEARIVSGELVDSKPLPAERDLMEEYGASRTVIREAISTLSSKGLIESRPRYRPIVRKPDYQTVIHAAGNIVQHLLNNRSGVKNLYDTRLFIERALVREAALSATKADITAMTEALVANQNAITDSLDFYRTDTEFHGILYRVPRNPIFPAIHQGFTDWLAPHWDQMLRSPERNQVNYRAHKAILDAIIDRDEVGADEALTNHLKSAWEYVRVTFE